LPVSFSRLRDFLQLLGLAAADEVARVGALAPSGHRGDRLGAGGDGELGELLQVFRIDGGAYT
jgi:hypothetical protein